MNAPVSSGLLGVLTEDLAIEPERICSDTGLTDLGVDSLAVSIALVAIEERLGARISEGDLRACDTVADVDALVDATQEGDAARGRG